MQDSSSTSCCEKANSIPKEKSIEKYIDALNSVPMLWLSGLCLALSFVTEYIVPIAGGSFTFPVNPAWLSLFISGLPLAKSAISNVLAGRIKSSLLITIAMIAAVYIGDVFAAGEVAFIMALGGWLEDRTVAKAKKGIESLLNLLPDLGRKLVRLDDGSLQEEMLDAKDLHVGDIVRVFPGESFSADGVIIDGVTSVDQSIMTGESLPIDKSPGDTVFAGTINRFGSVDVEVRKAFSDSSLQKMIRLVEDAENNKAPTQRLVDKWAGWLVPLACVIAVITYVVIAYGMGQSDVALVRAVTVLVVFCPCALALATPTTIMAAIGQATKQGVLIKSGEALEQMGKIDTIAFDKTGTLTHGKLVVSDIVPYAAKEADLLSLVASVESRSEHPIGKAITAYAKEQKVAIKETCDFTMLAGKGVSAKLGERTITCGNEKLFVDERQILLNEAIYSDMHRYQAEGKAIVLVADDTQFLGIFALSDTVKEQAKKAIEDLQAVGIKKNILLSGDNERAASYIAEKVGIKDVSASLLPEGKVEVIQKLQENGSLVCMVGDGVNDAPALKVATVGIAMGTMGSDIAIEAADIALMGDDISKIAYIKKLSNIAIKSINFNILMAMTINFGAIILSVLGYLGPASGALVHNAGSVLVVLNAARLYDKKID